MRSCSKALAETGAGSELVLAHGHTALVFKSSSVHAPSTSLTTVLKLSKDWKRPPVPTLVSVLPVPFFQTVSGALQPLDRCADPSEGQQQRSITTATGEGTLLPSPHSRPLTSTHGRGGKENVPRNFPHPQREQPPLLLGVHRGRETDPVQPGPRHPAPLHLSQHGFGHVH